ncbi:helix-turn-helix domain-containing protein [Cohnella sp.]|uniref:helix-turn-helix domain-containing protein n=1 Tax=Cohnella sp. TaxID=1883426 RepID=UPI003703ED46
MADGRMPSVRTVFMRFIVHYMILLLVISGIGGYVYNRSFELAKREAIETGIVRLEKSMALLDSRLNEVESIGTQISLDGRLGNLLNAKLPYGGDDYYAMKELSDNLANYKLGNRLIREAFVYLNKGAFISSMHPTAEVEAFYGKLFRFSNLTYAQWRDYLLGDYRYAAYYPETSVTVNGSLRQVITYVQSVPIGALNTYKGAVVVLLDASEVKELLSGAIAPSRGWIYVVSPGGERITGTGYSDMRELPSSVTQGSRGYKEQTVDGEKMIVMHAESGATGWKYVAAIPQSVISEKVAYIKRLYIYTMIVTITVGLLIAVAFSYSSSRPILNIVRKLRSGFGEPLSDAVRKGSTWDYLDGTISELIANRNELKRDLSRQMEIVKATFLERLLRGGFSKEPDIEAVRSYIDLGLEGDRFVAVVVGIIGVRDASDLTPDLLKRLDLAKVLVQEEFRRHLAHSMKFYHLDEWRTVLLIGLDVGDMAIFRHEIEASAEAISLKLAEEFGIGIALGVGKPCDHLIRIRNSFDEALQALEAAETRRTAREPVFFGDILHDLDDYYYPTDVETRMMNLIKSGDEAEVRGIIDELRKRNVAEARLSPESTAQLAYEMRGTAVKLRKAMALTGQEVAERLETRMDALIGHRSPAQLFLDGEALFLELCRIAASSRSGQKDHWKDKILNIVHARFEQDDLSLTTLATELGIKEKYVSQLFKEQIGESFTQYLEMLRMDRAARLLGDPAVTVQDISRLSGYATPNTFYKAFKRHYGVSPTIYRQQRIGLEDPS